MLDKIKAHTHQPPPPLADFRSDVPAHMQSILDKMLAKDPARRYQTPGSRSPQHPRRQIILQAEVTGERDDGNKALAVLRDKFKALSRESDAFVSSLDEDMHGWIAATNVPYTTPQREGLIRVTMARLGSREPKISKWRLVIQAEEWPLANTASLRCSANQVAKSPS